MSRRLILYWIFKLVLTGGLVYWLPHIFTWMGVDQPWASLMGGILPLVLLAVMPDSLERSPQRP